MNKLKWIRTALAGNGFQIPAELSRILCNGCQERSPYYFLDEDEAREQSAHMGKVSDSGDSIAFAVRRDYDGVVCLILADGRYRRGHVTILHWEGWPGSYAEFTSLAEWAREAEAEIAERAATGESR